MIRPSACQAHPGGEVVEREQVRQRRGVGSPALQVVKQAKLPLQQGLVAPGQAHEHLADPAAQAGLGGGRGDRGPLHAGECLGRAGDLSDLHVGDRGRVGLGRNGLPTVQPGHQVGEPLVREAPRRGLQAGDVAGHPAREPEHHHGRDEDGDEADHVGQCDPDQHRAVLGGPVVLEPLGERGARETPDAEHREDRDGQGCPHDEPDRAAPGAPSLAARQHVRAHAITPRSGSRASGWHDRAAPVQAGTRHTADRETSETTSLPAVG